jgi:hypothetical protein
MKTTTLDTRCTQLETIQRRSPKDFAALGVMVDMVLERLNKTTATERGIRGRLLSRLQAVHDCQQPDGGQFEQLPPHGRRRSWKCSGCDRIITDDEIAPREGGA